jgi:hypothetical protein
LARNLPWLQYSDQPHWNKVDRSESLACIKQTRM